jgi:hypothetical protein
LKRLPLVQNKPGLRIVPDLVVGMNAWDMFTVARFRGQIAPGIANSRGIAASMSRRLFAARPPLSVGLPGNRSQIRAHCASLNIRRFMSHIQKTG